MAKKRKTKKSIKEKGNWRVTFEDGTTLNVGYYPNPRMAVAQAMGRHKSGKVKSVKYVK